MSGVEAAAAVKSRWRPAIGADARQSARSARDFLRIRVGTSRRGGTCAFGVDFPLGRDRRGLIGWKCVHGKETGRVSGQPVDRDHPDPGIDGVIFGRVCAQMRAQRTDLPKCPGMVEGEEIVGSIRGPRPVDGGEAGADGVQRRRTKPRLDEDAAERVDVVAEGRPAEQGGLEDGRAAAHEGVVDHVAWFRQTLDEEPRQLRLEAGAVGNLVQRMGGALAAGPELVHERPDRRRAAVLHRCLRRKRLAARPDERTEVVFEGFGSARGGRLRGHRYQQLCLVHLSR